MNLNNNRGTVLLGVFLIGFTVMTLVMITFKVTNATTETVKKRKENINAFNIAEAGKEIALADLRSGKKIPESDSTIVFYSSFPFGGGNFTVTCEGSSGLDTIILISEAIHGDEKAIIKAICQLSFTNINVNCNVDAAITTRSEITTSGTIVVDGRDWNAAGNTIVGTGVKGIKTCGAFTQKGNSQIGGDGNAPAKKVSDPIIEEYASSTGYPETPEEVLGLPAGILDAYKTDTLPTLPFNGICYYTPAGEVKAPDLTGSSGIFICHNDSKTASLKNFHGDFKGLLISDRINHVNATALILGAVFTLSEQSGTNAFGNGNSDIKYSSEVLADLGNISVQVGGTNYDVVSWRQLK